MRTLHNQNHTHTMTNPLTAIILLPRLTDPASRRLGPVPPRHRPEDPLALHTILGHFTESVHGYCRINHSIYSKASVPSFFHIFSLSLPSSG